MKRQKPKYQDIIIDHIGFTSLILLQSPRIMAGVASIDAIFGIITGVKKKVNVSGSTLWNLDCEIGIVQTK